MDELNSILEQCRDKSKQQEQDGILLQPFVYIQQIPGKNVRAKLAIAFNYWLNIPEDKLKNIGEIVQMLHNSSLLIDDIEDNSILRRGVPVAHSIYGVASTINAANYVFFLALEKVQQLGHESATQVYTEQLLELHRGQGMEIYWRDNFTCPTESEYQQMTIRKTGGLFMLAIRLMQLFSDNKRDFSKLTAILGLYFQIRDDYCNLICKEYSENKSFCEDLTEGKFSFPIIHAVHYQKQDRQVLHILRQRTRDIEVKKYCINLLDKLGSFTYTRDILEKLDQEARQEVAYDECIKFTYTRTARNAFNMTLDLKQSNNNFASQQFQGHGIVSQPGLLPRGIFTSGRLSTTYDAGPPTRVNHQILATDYKNYAFVWDCLNVNGTHYNEKMWYFDRQPNPVRRPVKVEKLIRQYFDEQYIRKTDQGPNC